MINKNWEQIKSLISKRLYAPSDILDKIAVYDILVRAVSGFSNKDIAISLEIPEEYIQPAIVKFLFHYGFREKLDYSPIDYYKKHMGNSTRFIEEIMDLDPELELPDIHAMIRMCESYEKIREEIDEYYRRETDHPA